LALSSAAEGDGGRYSTVGEVNMGSIKKTLLSVASSSAAAAAAECFFLPDPFGEAGFAWAAAGSGGDGGVFGADNSISRAFCGDGGGEGGVAPVE